MTCTKAMILAGSLLGGASPVQAAAAAADPITAVWNETRIRCAVEAGIARIETTGKQCVVRIDAGDNEAHLIVIRSDEIVISSSALRIEGRRRWEVGPCIEIDVAAARDRIAIKVIEQHSTSRSSESSKSETTNDVSNTTSSSSRATAITKELKSLEIVAWNGSVVDVSLEGGNSLESSIAIEGAGCRIEFNIDEGKNRRVIDLAPGKAKVDDSQIELGGTFSVLSVAATRKALTVTIDGDVVAQWNGDTSQRLPQRP